MPSISAEQTCDSQADALDKPPRQIRLLGLPRGITDEKRASQYQSGGIAVGRYSAGIRIEEVDSLMPIPTKSSCPPTTMSSARVLKGPEQPNAVARETMHGRVRQ